MKTITWLGLTMCLTVSPLLTYAQIKKCGDESHWQQIKKRDKTKGIDLQQIKSSFRIQAPTIATIPVVVHVLYNTAAQNISTEQINSQIEVLNKDYRKLNGDASKVPSTFSTVSADCAIQFCLAQRDPYGLPTTGITRTMTSKTSFSNSLDDAMYTSMGGHDAWNADEYLNIWVVPNLLSSGELILAYASSPGDPKEIDGIVVGNKYFGTMGTTIAPFNLGRTATHEVGHWLGLYHTFQDGCTGTSSASCAELGDLVCDTPPVANRSYDCPSTKNTCFEAEDKIDMTMNFMDYVDDGCMYMFTYGQKDRMWYHLNNFRSGLFSSKGCTPPIQIDNNIALADLEGVSSFGLCNTSFAPKVSIVNIGNNNANEISLEYGTTANHTSVTWNANLPKGTKATIALDPLPLASGDNTYYVKVLTINGVSDQDTNKNILSQNIKVLPLRQLPFTEDFESELDFETNWKVVNYGNDLMWQRSDLAAAGGSYALFVDNTSGDKSGEIDDIYGPLFHIQKDATLSFDYAYSLYTEIGTDMRDFSDTLRIFLDVECAGTPSKIFEGFGEDFTTRVPYHTTDRFIPTATEWRHLSVDLSSFEGKKARLILRNISDIENSLFIDNINLSDTPLSSDDMEVAEGIAVYPTLAQQQVEVICHVPYEVALYSSTGILMQTQQNQTDLVKFDISKYPDQLFIFQIRTASGIKNFKIIKRTR